MIWKRNKLTQDHEIAWTGLEMSCQVYTNCANVIIKCSSTPVHFMITNYFVHLTDKQKFICELNEDDNTIFVNIYNNKYKIWFTLSIFIHWFCLFVHVLSWFIIHILIQVSWKRNYKLNKKKRYRYEWLILKRYQGVVVSNNLFVIQFIKVFRVVNITFNSIRNQSIFFFLFIFEITVVLFILMIKIVEKSRLIFFFLIF